MISFAYFKSSFFKHMLFASLVALPIYWIGEFSTSLSTSLLGALFVPESSPTIKSLVTIGLPKEKAKEVIETYESLKHASQERLDFIKINADIFDAHEQLRAKTRRIVSFISYSLLGIILLIFIYFIKVSFIGTGCILVGSLYTIELLLKITSFLEFFSTIPFAYFFFGFLFFCIIAYRTQKDNFAHLSKQVLLSTVFTAILLVLYNSIIYNITKNLPETSLCFIPFFTTQTHMRTFESPHRTVPAEIKQQIKQQIEDTIELLSYRAHIMQLITFLLFLIILGSLVVPLTTLVTSFTLFAAFQLANFRDLLPNLSIISFSLGDGFIALVPSIRLFIIVGLIYSIIVSYPLLTSRQ